MGTENSSSTQASARTTSTKGTKKTRYTTTCSIRHRSSPSAARQYAAITASITVSCAHHNTTSDDIPPPLRVVSRKKARPARFITGMAMLSHTNNQSESHVTKPENDRDSHCLCFRMACMMPRDQRYRSEDH